MESDNFPMQFVSENQKAAGDPAAFFIWFFFCGG
jgi:hypothetical protein